jgi:hypothetical protein
VKDIKFEHVSNYSEWRENSATVTPVLKDFNTTVNIILKRDPSDMQTEQARQQLKLVGTPNTEVRAHFDTDVRLELKPDVFIKLCMITDLL